MEQEVVLQVDKLCKSFGVTKANIDVDLTLHRGEVLGLAGENGSGKSTLLSQIAGILSSSSGSMTLFGAPYKPSSPVDANRHKVAMVVQELGVIPVLPAAINVYLGRTEPFQRFGMVNMKKLYAQIGQLAREWGLPELPLGQICANMSVESRKIVELLRALSVDPEILILDEVTQALSFNNRQTLCEIIRRFKESGKSVILISHDLEEMVELTDTITVLRDGMVVGTVSSPSTSVSELKRMMIGRRVDGDYYRNDAVPSRRDEKVLEVRDLCVGDEVHDVSFDVYSGEILGFCGLSDSGIHAVGKALYGLAYDRQGTVLLKTDGVALSCSNVSLRRNVAYVPKERDGEGLMIQASIKDNLCLPDVDNLAGKCGFLSPAKLNAHAETSKTQFEIRCQDIFQRTSGLSGGNKQKINLGRWMAKPIQLLILDCPTRGVDVGVKAYIYQLMRQAKEDGVAIVLISDELTEALGMSDRICVLKDGRIAKEIQRGPDFSEDTIIEVMI